MREKKKFYSVTEIAKLLRVSRQAILNRIERGTLSATKIGETYAIPGDEAERVARQGKK